MRRRAPSPRAARASRAARYRTCLHLASGRAWACEWPWRPGESREPMGPFPRPCFLCELSAAMLRAFTRALHEEMAAEKVRRDALTYRAMLEADPQEMALVRAAEAGVIPRIGPRTCALMMLREHGSVDAALRWLTSQPDVYVDEFFRIVEVELRLMDVPMGQYWRRYFELYQEAAE